MEVKDIIAYLGLDDKLDTIDELKTAFGAKFITKADADSDPDIRSKVSGHMMGGITTEAKKLFGFTTEEIKDKDVKEILRLGHKKLNDTIKVLEESQGKPDEKYTTLKKEYDTLKIQADQYKGDLDKTVEIHTKEKETFIGQIKEVKKETAYEKALSTLPWSGTIKKVEIAGFNSIVKSKYEFDIDDKGDLTVTQKDGKKVPNPEKAGDYLNANQVLEIEAKQEGLLKQNTNPGGEPIYNPTRKAEETTETGTKPYISETAKNHVVKQAPVA